MHQIIASFAPWGAPSSAPTSRVTRARSPSRSRGSTIWCMAGPASSLHATDDSTEPYQFVPGDDYDNGAITYLYSVNDQPAGLAAWVEDFKAAYAADNSDPRRTLILDDGS